MKNRWKTISTEEELDAVSRHEKGEQIGDIRHNVRSAHGSTHTICNNADKITESANPRTKVFVKQHYHRPIGMIHMKNYGCESLTFLLH